LSKPFRMESGVIVSVTKTKKGWILARIHP
jgi:hypothetical protein